MIGLASPLLTRGICAPARSLAALTRRRLGSARNARDRGALQIVSEGTGRFIVGGNWKCNGDRASVTALIEALNGGDVGDNVDVVVAPPFLYVDQALSELKSPMQVAAQNAWVEYTLEDETHHYDSDSGAFTGEVRLSRDSTRPTTGGGRDRSIDRPFVRSDIGRSVDDAARCHVSTTRSDRAFDRRRRRVVPNRRRSIHPFCSLRAPPSVRDHTIRHVSDEDIVLTNQNHPRVVPPPITSLGQHRSARRCSRTWACRGSSSGTANAGRSSERTTPRSGRRSRTRGSTASA